MSLYLYIYLNSDGFHFHLDITTYQTFKVVQFITIAPVHQKMND